MRVNEFMWCALDKRGRINATWYHGRLQSLKSWREAVTSLGWQPIHCRVKSLPITRRKPR